MPKHSCDQDTMAKTKTIPDRSANSVDIYVGGRLRALRMLRGLTQDNLAEFVGLTFQQIQKYENGANRMSASRIFSFSKALKVSAGYFWDGYEDANARQSQGERVTVGTGDVVEGRESIELYRAIGAMSSRTRKAFLQLIQSLEHEPGNSD